LKVIISFVTFNNLKYTKLCLNSIKCSYPYEILVIDNGSIDGTQEWLKTQNVTLIENGQNMGVPYCCNIMYDYAWKNNKDNYLVAFANDMIFLPNTIDELVKGAEETPYSVISGDSRWSPYYLAVNPDLRKYFKGGNRISLNASTMATWSPGDYYSLIESTGQEFVDILIKDLSKDLPKHEVLSMGDNCWFVPGHRIYKYKYFETVGYWDVNFYPIYAVDFDHAVRAKIMNQKCYMLPSSVVFEFWSRTLYEGVVPVIDRRRNDYLIDKWGGDNYVNHKFNVPFNNLGLPKKYEGYDTSSVSILSRVGEKERIKQLGGSDINLGIRPVISGKNEENYSFE
jgi:GT2 family glycosyltransferase